MIPTNYYGIVTQFLMIYKMMYIALMLMIETVPDLGQWIEKIKKIPKI